MDATEDLHKLLDGHSVRCMKLKKLDKLLEGHEDHVLNAYILWLQEGFIADTAPQAHLTKPEVRAALFQSWCDRLRNHGLNCQHIFDTFCDRTAHQTSIDSTNQFHLENIKRELRLVLFRPRLKKHQSLDQPPVAADNAQVSVQYLDSHTKNLNDNEEHCKPTMVSNKADISGGQRPQKTEVSSDSDSGVPILSSYQGAHQRRRHSPLPSLDLTPGPRGSDRPQKSPVESKQEHSPYYDHEPRSPLFMGASIHGQVIHRYSATDQPNQVAPNTKDSRLQHDNIHSDDEASVRLKKQMQGFRAESIMRRKEAEDQQEATKKERRVRELKKSVSRTVSKGNAQQFVSGSEASYARQSKSGRYQTKKAEKPHDEYLCYRCEVPGHFLQDCPTNLNPSFDRTPVGGYKCMICKKIQTHLTTLCPENTDPKSLTQLRLKLGTVTTRRLQGKDDDRPAYGKTQGSRLQQRAETFDSLNDVTMNEDRLHAILELGKYSAGQLFDEDSFESRHMQAKRTYSRQQSPEDDRVIDDRNSPPSKRIRKDDRKQERDRERGREHHRQSGWNSSRDREHLIHFTSPSRDGKSNDYYMGSSELLASLDLPRADSGRLSYWDSGYQTPPAPKQNNFPKYQGPAFSSSPLRTRKQPVATEYWSEDDRVEEIKHLYPHADSDWVDEMASFDVDKFFEDMDDLRLSSPFDAQAATSGIQNNTEQLDDSGQFPLVTRTSGKFEDVEGFESVEDNNPYSPRGYDELR